MAAEKASSTKSSKRAGATSALEVLASELDDVSESEFVHINIDVVAAVTTALGVLPKLEKLSDSIKELPLDHGLVAKFETYALALYEAHAEYLAASRPQESLSELVEKGTQLRDRLYADVQALVVRGLANAQEIREVRTSVGHKALAVDLTLLTDAVQRRWKEIQGKTAIQLEEVLEAEQLATLLLRAVGEREQAPTVVADAAATRSRAYTLFVRAYDEVRRAVTFLRWDEGDADAVIPSLYQGRGGRSRKDDAPAVTPEAPPVPSAAAPPAANSPPGTPNSSPFMNE